MPWLAYSGTGAGGPGGRGPRIIERYINLPLTYIMILSSITYTHLWPPNNFYLPAPLAYGLTLIAFDKSQIGLHLCHIWTSFAYNPVKPCSIFKILWTTEKFWKYSNFRYVCHLHTKHSLEAACYSLKPEMLQESSRNSKNYIKAMVPLGQIYRRKIIFSGWKIS